MEVFNTYQYFFKIKLHKFTCPLSTFKLSPIMKFFLSGIKVREVISKEKYL